MAHDSAARWWRRGGASQVVVAVVRVHVCMHGLRESGHEPSHYNVALCEFFYS